jgi:DNA (cytosine-5)-methyltransferase 1
MSERPLLLDLYCGLGGSSMGYYKAGFDVIGVDNEAQPHFPFGFYRQDALEFLDQLRVRDFTLGGRKVQVIHASPPCQRFVALGRGTHWEGFDALPTDLLAPTRAMLRSLDMPYVIENVPGAPMETPITLCGSMFDLKIDAGYLQRHRLFESNIQLMVPGPCRHKLMTNSAGEKLRAMGVYGNGRGGGELRNRTANADQARALLGIDWGNRAGITQAVPPAYTEYIGKQIMEQL